MDRLTLGERVELVTRVVRDVFTTMLGLELRVLRSFENPKPLDQGEVSALIGLAGDPQGFVAVHCTRAQAQELTARLLELPPREVADVDAMLDAVGELINMIAGNVKSELAPRGDVQISLPTVVTTPKSEIRVKAGASVVVELDGAAGAFRVELMLADSGS